MANKRNKLIFRVELKMEYSVDFVTIPKLVFGRDG